jgi:hypothetical protein
VQVQVTRTKNVDRDRRGNIRGVTYTMAFGFVMNDAERAAIFESGLSTEVIFQSSAKTVVARELIDGEAQWNGLTLSLALSIQNSMIENCGAYAKLVRTATTFEGRHTIDLSPA